MVHSQLDTKPTLGFGPVSGAAGRSGTRPFPAVKTRTVHESRTSLIDGSIVRNAGKDPGQRLTAARMHTTTPANSGVISYRPRVAQTIMQQPG